MKVVHVSYLYDDRISSEEELLEQHYTITGWAEALQRGGIDVTVVNRFNRESSFQKNGVQYYFVKDSLRGILKTRQLPMTFLKRIAGLDADVVHLHNLSLSFQTYLLRRMLKKETAIIIQHHGGVAPGKLKRGVHNLFNRVADGFFFTSAEQGQEWLMKKKPFDKIMPVMEGATFFNYPDRYPSRITTFINRTETRKKTNLKGSPVFLWVGRLDNNKDPLTVLNGFESLFEKFHDANLYMIYSDDSLLRQIKEKLNGSEILKTRVHLLGKIDHSEIEQFYNSSDYFVLGSHYEGSGYALSEALRCGCVPIITDIPSFRVMTNEGRLGALWEPGNSQSFIKAANNALGKPLEQEANACIEFFGKKLSFDAIAKDAIKYYQKVVEQRKKNMS